jgi:cation:H+ antiporter
VFCQLVFRNSNLVKFKKIFYVRRRKNCQLNYLRLDSWALITFSTLSFQRVGTCYFQTPFQRAPLNVINSLVLVACGLVLLVVGADALVSGASRIAQRFGIPPLIIGLTIVAIGTSMPEITVSATAAISGNSALALGNVVGSNIFNVLLILGLAAVILPLSVHVSLIRQEVPVMVGFSLLLFVLVFDGSLSKLEAALLFVLGVVYLLLLLVQARRAAIAGQDFPVDLPDVSGWLSRVPAALLIVLGLVGLVGGAQLLVQGASAIALSIGVSELVVGLTVVAIGTSLPEVAASVAAALRGQRDIAIGNVVGSNIFNIALCLGLAGLVAPDGLEAPQQLIAFDMRVMVVVALVLLPLIITEYEVSRQEGLLLLFWSAVYLVWTVLTATGNPHLSWFSDIVLLGLLPATIVFLGATVITTLRGSKNRLRP